jgi:SOS-response transcriptional repressor LexA
MAEVHISADELGRRTGIPASTIKKIRNRYNPNPTLTTLLPLAQFFSITLGQLVGDEDLPVTRIKGLYQPSINKATHLPIISWQESICWPDTKLVNHTTVSTEYVYDKNAFALLVEEANWENFAQGTALLIDPTLSPEHRDFVITHKAGQSNPTLKQILYDEGEMYLKPVILGYNIAQFSPDHRIIGIVVEYKKHLKKNN